ncbi:hypothetical protein N7495_008471 [Penicillium taxi]|uniref:uncharacterized protein n=1 Tax=Penicillium taxi TaxID=168475 RepID=UPI002545AB5E|nr:uncharacterized protein N7495_008471 [Penicillium taxi]KAJ5888430.1 hypothetical protein N7495_008471 [Penicillium taxi]
MSSQDYVDAQLAREKWAINYACESIKSAEAWGEAGPWNYAPYPINNTRYTVSSDADYDSIMFNNGLPLSRKGKLGVYHRVITTAKGKKIKGRDWSSGPSDADISAIKAIWGRTTIPDLPLLDYSIIDPEDDFGKPLVQLEWECN